MKINPKKILVIQHKQIGDVILTTPTVKALKEHFPDAHITFLTEKFCAPILEGNPYIDEIVSFDKKELKSLFSQLRFYWSIRKMKFDLVVDFFQNPRSTLITAMSGAETTLSYDHPVRGRFYKLTVTPKPAYAVDYKLHMLTALGIESDDNYPIVAVPESAQKSIDDYLKSVGIKDGDFIVSVDATHKRATREWTRDGYAGLVDLLCAHYDAKVILTYGPGEYERVKIIQDMCRYECYISPETTLKQLAALIKRSHILIGNDSAPRHLAVSQNTPTLAVAGSTSDGWLHPDPIHRVIRKGIDCQPCRKSTCDYDIKCMKTLSSQEVFDALNEFIDLSDTLKHFLTREVTHKPSPKKEVANG